jgi:hypothetical protein
MKAFVSDALEIARARFPSELLPEGGDGSLCGRTPALADEGALLFECRLGTASAPIDLSQQFHAEYGGPAQLLALAERRASLLDAGAADIWARLAVLAAAWTQDSALRQIQQLWLEHDALPNGAWLPVPAVFAMSQGDVLGARSAADRLVETLAPERHAAFCGAMAAMEAAERHGMRSGRMMGLMFSRGSELRATVARAEPGRLAAYLDDINWPGDPATVVDVVADVASAAVPPVLVLGFDPDPVLDWGLEIFPPKGADAQSLDGAFDWLVRRNAADPRRAAAARRWEDTLTPVELECEWPSAMIIQDLIAPPELPEVLGLDLNHLKINFRGDEVLAAKVYLGLKRRSLSADA